MLEKFLKVAVLLRAVDNATAPLRGVVRAIEAVDRAAEKTKHLRAMGESMQQWGRQALVASAVAAAAIAIPVKAYGELENATTRAQLAFLTNRGVDSSFAGVEKVALRLGALLPGNTADFMKMAAALKETGVSAAAIAGGGLEATGYLRVLIGDMSPEEAGRTMATFRNSLGIAESDFVKFVDQMQRAKFAKGLDLTEFAFSAKYIGAIGKELGLGGLEASTGLLALAAAASQAGIRGEQFGTSMREALSRMSQVDQLMKRGGIDKLLSNKGIRLDFFTDQGKFAGLENMVKQLAKLNALTDEDRLRVLSKLFGDSAAPTLAIFSKLGVGGFHGVLGEMGEQASLMDRINLVLGLQQSKWEAFTGTMTNFAAAIGKSVAPAVRWLFGAMNTLADKATTFIQNHQIMTSVVLGVVAAFAVVAFTAFVVATALGTYIVWALAARNISTMFNFALSLTSVGLRGLLGPLAAATASVISFTVALLANPVTWIVLAIAAAVALLAFAIYKYWTPLKNFIAGLWRTIEENPLKWAVLAALGPVALLGAAIHRHWTPIKTLVLELWDGVKGLTGAVRSLLNISLGDVLRAALSANPVTAGLVAAISLAQPATTAAGSAARASAAAPATRAAAAMAAAHPAATAAAPVVAASVAAPATRVASNQAKLAASAAARPTSSAGPRGFTYSPTINLPAGTPAATAAAAQRAIDADRPNLEAMVRRLMAEQKADEQRKAFKR